MSLPSGSVVVTRTHLWMGSIADLRRAPAPPGAATLVNERVSADRYLEMYAAVGGPWFWRDRLRMDRRDLEAYLESPDVHVWSLEDGSRFAGYFELQRYADGRVEIMYFGLTRPFIGRGLGGWMLTRAVEEAFAFGATHVTVHTCTLDGPAALPNYLARGFRIEREEQYTEDVTSQDAPRT